MGALTSPKGSQDAAETAGDGRDWRVGCCWGSGDDSEAGERSNVAETRKSPAGPELYLRGDWMRREKADGG